MDEEPLADFAERRDARIGRLRAVPVVAARAPRAAHVSPAEPRVVERWNGHVWEMHAVVPDLAAAKALLYPLPRTPPPAEGPPRPPLAKGTGRHREPRVPPTGP